MRETAEWRGRTVTRLVWERLPSDHPQAVPVWERLRDKRRRTKQAGLRRAQRATQARNSSRPAWNDNIAITPAVSAKGLKCAKDKVMAPRPKDLGLRPLEELV